MFTYSLILAAQVTTPHTAAWSPAKALIMIFCNAVAIFIGYYAIQQPGKGPSLPVPQLASRKPFGLPELLATTSFGHILGTGMILGLSNAGIL